MASVGSVELTLALNTTRFDKQLRSLESLQLKPLNLDVKLNSRSLTRQLQNVSGTVVSVELSPDIKGFSRKLKDLPKSLVDCLEVCIDPDIKKFKRKLSAIYDLDIDCLPIELCPDLEDFDRKTKKSLASKKYSTSIGLDTDGFKDNIEGAFTDALKRVQGDGIISKLGGSLFAPIKLAAAAIAPIFLGLGASIGLPLGSQIGTGLAKGLQSKFGTVIGSFELVGDTAGRLIGGGVESGFTKALEATKANAPQIVKILEESIGKKRLTQLFGGNYRAAIQDAIEGVTSEFGKICTLRVR